MSGSLRAVADVVNAKWTGSQYKGETVPDRRLHRGSHPQDEELFGPASLPALQRAIREFCWLLDRGYATPSAMKLVGDRYQLRERQRTAVLRCSCTRLQRQNRLARRVSASALAGSTICLDGYNVLTTVEAAMGGAVLLIGRDGAVRDICSLHGTWRRVSETVGAVRRIGEFCAAANVLRCIWLLDRPVSNSGRLKTLLRELAEDAGWDWQIDLVGNVDQQLIESPQLVCTADSVILERCSRWFPLANSIVDSQVKDVWLVDLSQAFGTVDGPQTARPDELGPA